jgi:hypothetical protein
METSVSERSADKGEKLETTRIHSSNWPEPTSNGSLDKEEGPELAGTFSTETGRAQMTSQATSSTLVEEQELSERFGDHVYMDETFTMVRCFLYFFFQYPIPTLFFHSQCMVLQPRDLCIGFKKATPNTVGDAHSCNLTTFHSTDFPSTQSFTSVTFKILLISPTQ